MTNDDLIADAYDIGMLQQYEEIPLLVERVRLLQPRNVMEIGSCHGGTFYIWCKLAAIAGVKISLDLPNGNWGATDYMDPESLAKRATLFKSWSDNVHVLSGNSHSAEIKEEVRRILDGSLLDFLFIDGDHSREGVTMDYEMYKEFVRPGGLIGFHDIRNTQHHRDNFCFVHEFWNTLQLAKEEIIDPLGCWGGIGLVAA